jgi:DHA1 family tetracycline resistance protein-like MFS transporter
VRLPLIFILATTMIDSMGIGLILPVMPALLREIGDFPLADAALYGGVLATSFAVMQFVFGPVIGALSDRFGRRPVMLGSLLVMSLDYIVMAVAQVYWLLLIGRLVGGISAATQSTASAFMADISKPEEKAARFGLIGASFGIGFVLGPLLGGLLAEFGTRAPFYAAAGLAGANMTLGFFVMPETVTDKTRRPLSRERTNPLGAFRSVSAKPELRRLLILFFLYQVAFIVYPSIWAYFTEERFGWSPGMIGLSLASFGIAMAVVQGGLIRFILKWLGERGTVIYGLAFNFVAFLVIALVESGTVALLFTPLIALGAVVTPAIQGIMSRLTSDDSQGELQGVLSSTAALAMIISPLVMTQAFAAFVREDAAIYLPGAPFLLSMVLMVACAAVFLTMPKAETVRS